MSSAQREPCQSTARLGVSFRQVFSTTARIQDGGAKRDKPLPGSQFLSFLFLQAVRVRSSPSPVIRRIVPLTSHVLPAIRRVPPTIRDVLESRCIGLLSFLWLEFFYHLMQR